MIVRRKRRCPWLLRWTCLLAVPVALQASSGTYTLTEASHRGPTDLPDPVSAAQELQRVLSQPVSVDIPAYEAPVPLDGSPASKTFMQDIARERLRQLDKPYEPFCLYYPFLHSLGLVCPIVTFVASVMIYKTPSFESICIEREVDNPHNVLPEPLLDLRGRMPRAIDRAVIQEEKATYAWYLKYVYAMYGYVYRVADATRGVYGERLAEELMPTPPPGWGDQHVFFEKGLDGWTFPLGQSVRRGSHLLFILRGSMFRGDWKADFTYSFADRNATEALGLPGRVHRGLFDLTEALMAQVELHKDILDGITEVTFTGHSLGGFVSILGAAIWAARFPDMKMNAIAFAVPHVADKTLSDWISEHVNLRSVMYLGSAVGTAPGLQTFKEGVGDMIPQLLPSCPGQPFPICRGLPVGDPPTEETAHEYGGLRGVVPFFSTDLENSAAWEERDTWVVTDVEKSMEHLMVKHLCSYPCWLSQALNDVENRCFFPGDPGNHTDVCDLEPVVFIQDRFPWMIEPPPPMGTPPRQLRGGRAQD